MPFGAVSQDVMPADVALLGARNLDPPEEAYLAATAVRRGIEGLPARVYVALDCDVVEPGELDVFMPEPDGPRLDDLERLLESIQQPVGAGITGLVPSERNESLLPRLVRALGF